MNFRGCKRNYVVGLALMFSITGLGIGTVVRGNQGVLWPKR